MRNKKKNKAANAQHVSQHSTSSIKQLRLQRRREKRIRKKQREEKEKLGTSQTTTSKEESSTNLGKLDRRILPKEHWESPYIDNRVYVPTLDDFSADANKRGSMLDEVAFLPAEDLASLLCGSRIYLMIRNSAVGMDMLDLCRAMKERHSRLNLQYIFV
ncbi:unnamed protein product [Strongylus vulgaris]|uniref:Uncharacterized protein n=1 Tax=Strongylus vulgaris TaxID=40348 RepID=A0A3P7IVZ7_STRVU|nr:unnamed protein product [Strongylus vulgaris]